MIDSPFAWATYLPADEIPEMLAEIAETADGTRYATDAETLAALDTVLAAWRSTAEAHTTPELLACPTCDGTGGDHQIGCQP